MLNLIVKKKQFRINNMINKSILNCVSTVENNTSGTKVKRYNYTYFIVNKLFMNNYPNRKDLFLTQLQI
jgi:hypothetical protein